MGCPPGHYFEYLLVNHSLEKSEFGYSYTLNHNIDFKIEVGAYRSFLKDIQSGISASFYFPQIEQIDRFKNLDIKIFSKNFGELQLVENDNFRYLPSHYFDNYVIFDSKLKKRNFGKKGIKNDTIFIELNGKTILVFAKKD